MVVERPTTPFSNRVWNIPTYGLLQSSLLQASGPDRDVQGLDIRQRYSVRCFTLLQTKSDSYYHNIMLFSITVRITYGSSKCVLIIQYYLTVIYL